MKTRGNVGENPIRGSKIKKEESMITIEDLAKVELKIGTVISAGPVAKSNKLLKLKVDFGEHTLVQADLPLIKSKFSQVLAGIGKSFKPEELIGKQFLFVTNLPPREMMGELSEAMILAVGDSESLSIMRPFPERMGLEGKTAK